MYHKIKKRQVKPPDVVKAGQQLSNSVRSTEKVFNPDSVQYASVAYKKHAGNIEACLKDTGYHLDNELSDREHKVFYNPVSKKAVVAYRGTICVIPKGFGVI